MPIKISKAMRAALPEDERENIEDRLWDKAGGRCFLCEEELNRAADNIEADHDIPESEGGPTDIANLNLAHDTCNRAKRAAKTVPIRPYLKLSAYTRKNGGRLKYDGYLEHFGIQPSELVWHRQEGAAIFELPDGSTWSTPIMSESNRAGTFEYVFLPIPRRAIYNDDACQPRTLRLDHAWSIYCDLQTNVLHEPPSCRLESPEENRPVRALMFDGQHKTIATWMMGREVVAAKLYLNMSTAQAVQLVNSIQAKIKKLPLSPFELAGKMSDEWENKFREYEEEVGTKSVSEAGFLLWLGPEKARGKQALRSALVQAVLANPDLRIMSHVKRQGAPAPTVPITEQTLKAKVVERLLHMEPLKDAGEEAQAIRDREATNIVLCLNTLTDAAFEPTPGASELTAVELERARRMTYQASLAYISSLIRAHWVRTFIKNDAKAPMDEQITGTPQEAQFTAGIERLVDHPVWTADFDRDDRMKRVKSALEKNQDVQKAMEDVGLDLAYVTLGDQSASYRNYWISTSN